MIPNRKDEIISNTMQILYICAMKFDDDLGFAILGKTSLTISSPTQVEMLVFAYYISKAQPPFPDVECVSERKPG